MKNFTKISLIIALCLGALGTVFCVTAYAMGADFRALSVWYDAESHKFYTEDHEEVAADFQESFSDIRKLELDIGQADMTIVPGTGDQFVVRASNVSSRFSCKQDGSRLKIKEESRKRVLGIDFSGLTSASSIVLEYPEGTVFDEMDVEVGVGSLVVTDTHVKKLESTCGVGSFAFSGEIDRECSLECGVGSMELNLIGRVGDFNYDIECGIGEIILGDSQFSGLGYEKKINNNAAKEMEMDCGVGEILVRFSDDSTSQDTSLKQETETPKSVLDENEQKREEYEEKLRTLKEQTAEYEKMLKDLEKQE